MNRTWALLLVCGPISLVGQHYPDLYNEQPKPSIGYWENGGQVTDSSGGPVNRVKFYSEGAQPRSWLSDSSRVAFSMTLVDGIPGTSDTMYNVHMFASGKGARLSKPEGYDPKPHYKSFHLDHTAPNGVSQVHGHDIVLYKDFFQDIDLKFYSGSSGARMTFICKPGFIPGNLVLGFQGQDSLNVDVNGTLRLYRNGRWLELRQAQAYQVDSTGTIVALNWNAEYETNGGQGIVTFQFDSYDPHLPVLLQIGPEPMAGANAPDALCWGTYFGGDDGERIHASATDSDGNYYVTGYSLSAFVTFPQTAGIQLVASGEAVFLTKFSPDHELLWTVYWGGAGDHTVGWGVAAKSPQEVYVAGYSVDNSLFSQPLTGAYNDQSATGVQRKAIIGKFSENGACLWSTYFGDGREAAYGLALDGLGRLLIVGETDGTGLPIQPWSGASSWAYAGGQRDGFMALFGGTDQLLWSTPYGSDEDDAAQDVRASGTGFVVSGWTEGDVTTVDGGAFAYDQGVNAGGTDAFILTFNTNAVCTWATAIGGGGEDRPGTNSLAIAPNGDILMVGGTSSTDMPTEPGNGWNDLTNAGQGGFILRFGSGSRQLVWGTYVSGTGENVLECVTTDALGNIYVGGYTEDATLPLAELSGIYMQDALVSDYQGTVQDGLDAMLMVFTPAHALVHSTYLGGGSGLLGESLHTLAWRGALLYAGGHTSKDLDPFSAFPLYNPGAPAWYDDLYFYPSTRDGFIVALCTDLFTGLEEHGHAGVSNGLIVLELDQGCFSVRGWDPGCRSLSVYDPSGRGVQQLAVAAHQRSVTLDLRHLAPGTYLLRSEGASPRGARIVRR